MSKFTDAAIAAAQLSQRVWGVPASVSLAQFALESAYGTKMPPGSNNPFGIKAVAGQPSVTVSTKEVIGGKMVTVQAKFRKFDSFDEAFDAHARLLATKSIYASAMAAWKTDRDLEKGIKLMAVKYATDPAYASKIMSIIQGQQLVQYDHEQPVAPKPMPAPAMPIVEKSNWLASLLTLILSLFKRKS